MKHVTFINPEMRRRHDSGVLMEDRRAELLEKRGEVIVLEKPENDILNFLSIAIPYASKFNIGRAYNMYMKQSQAEWVIFMDHDVLLVNPKWFEICRQAIIQHGDKCGLFTCYTNRIGCPLQQAPGVDNKSDDINYHRYFAKKLYNNNLGRVLDLTKAKYFFSGMFIMTSRAAWEVTGGFKEGDFFHIDVDYCKKIRKCGLKTMLMQDLYVYHGYFREVLKPFFTKE